MGLLKHFLQFLELEAGKSSAISSLFLVTYECREKPLVRALDDRYCYTTITCGGSGGGGGGGGGGGIINSLLLGE